MKRTVFALLAALCIACLSANCRADDTVWQIVNGPLMTRWAKEVSPNNSLPEYPRPQMQRTDWQNLNGLWDYAVTDKDAIQPTAYSGKILVPYPIESALSGVMKAFLPTQRLWYRRTFALPASWQGRQVLLHFGAVDWETEVWVNGRSVGTHRGGYDAFSFDVTRELWRGIANEIVVAVVDPSETEWQLRGKQTLHPGGASYTACSGIWQTVWLEPVSESAIESLHMVPNLKMGVLHLTITAHTTPHPMVVEAAALDGSKPIATTTASIGAELADVQENLVHFYKATSALVTTTIDLPIPTPHLWTSDDPFLYHLTVRLKSADGTTVTDAVQSYFGMRSLSIGKDAKGNMRFLLNGVVTMLPMVLDQGYWPDGIYTAPTDDALRFDLEAEKKLGVQVRKHVKVEPERWYYWADRLGVLVLQDMPTGGEGDPLTDRPTSPEAAAQCESEMRALIVQRWNHPSIISWNMFNEGWGQHDTVATAAWAKALDPSRLIDEASGFPWHGAGDIRDCHGGVPPKSDRQISIDTEDGSVGVATPGHDWPIGKLWTPITYDPTTGSAAEHSVEGQLAVLDDGAKAWFTRRVRGLFRALWVNRDATGQSGDSYCQITDTETEEDGLLSYDRAVWKVDPTPIRAAVRGEGISANVRYLIPTAAVAPTEWRYTTVKPRGGWFASAFNDSDWRTGQSAFGNGYDHVHTPWTETPGDIWLRREFTLTTKPSGAVFVRMIHDEGVEVYLNGVAACRDGGFIGAYDDFAVNAKAAATLKVGKNVIAVHCWQTVGGQVVDVGLVAE